MLNKINAGNFNKLVLTGTVIGLIIFAIPTIVIDPYFHYHAPLDSLQYPIDNERYQNNGIVRHFEYDALITGSSMTENFKTSQMDEIFGVNSIKVPLSGATYSEEDKLIKAALESNDHLKIVIRSLDSDMMLKDKDYQTREANPNYPHYMNDKNPLNDVKYVLNKAILGTTKNVLENTARNGGTTSFDVYTNWNSMKEFGQDIVTSGYKRATMDDKKPYTEEDRQMVLGNIRQNVVETAKLYPNTDFYYFIPPWSVSWFDTLIRNGSFEYSLLAEQTAIEEMLTCSNIQIFSFSNYFDCTTNMDNYCDKCHYGEWINTEMLQLMKDNQYRITADNYLNYLEEVRQFYLNYDYEVLYD